MANIIKSYRRVLAVGCSHGELANRDIQKQVLAFSKKFKPQIRFELGDIVDTACFRSGARGTPDEGRRPEPDEFSAIRWLQEYEPTNLSWGNHDVRLLELQNSPNAIVSYASAKLWNSLSDQVRKLKCKTVPYDIETGWFDVGNVLWGHGFMYSVNALRDHAEMLGRSVVMAHLHHPHMVNPRNLRHSPSYCVGTLSNIPAMSYARRRRQTLTWAHGLVYGEVSSSTAHLWLVTAEKGGTFRFPL